MRLLYIHQYFKFPSESGAVRSYDLSRSFIENGIEVIILGTNSHPTSKKRWEYKEQDGIKLYQLNCAYDNSMGFVKRGIAFLKFMFFSTLKALSIKCDIVLATSTPLTVALPALIKRKIQKIPYIMELRDVWPEVPIKMGIINNKIFIKILYWFEKITYKNAAWIVPLSTGMEENIKMRYKGNNITVIPNISHINRFSNIPENININIPIENKKIVLYAGTLGIVNGIQYVVDLAKETFFLDPDIIYLIVGSGKEKEKIVKYADSMEILNKNIYFLESISKNNLSYLYSKCTIGSSFVIDNPVLWDNSANKFFDTLAASKPILINHEGWQANAIRKYNMGYILPPVVNRKAAEDFVDYLNNEELIKNQGRNAFQIGKDEFSLKIASEKYITIINSIH